MRNKKTFLPIRASSGWHEELLIYTGMTVPLSRMVALAFAVLVLGAATTASARPKKQSAEHTATTTTNCHGTPLIMQGMDCPTRPVRAAEQGQQQEQEQEQQQEQATKRAERPRLTARGSSGAYIAPLQRTPSLSLPPAIGGSLHSAAGQQPQRADQSIESLFST